MSESIQKIWKSICSLLDAKFPETYTRLNPPATEAELSILRDVTGGNPPQDLIALYKGHNGAGSGCFMNNLGFLEISEAIEEINALKEHLWVSREDNVKYEADEGINISDYSPDEVPVFLIGIDNSYDQFLCVEYRNDKAHVDHGRVIYIDCTTQRSVKVANSIGDLLTDFYNDLKKNRYYSYGDGELEWRDRF